MTTAPVVTANTKLSALPTQDIDALTNFEKVIVPGSSKKAMQGAKSRDLWNIDPRKVRFLPGFNPRVEGPKLDAHIRWLADQMKEHGYDIDKPIAVIIVREGDEDVAYAADGHCRTRGALLAISEGAPIDTITAVTLDRGASLEELTVKLFRSNTGKSLTPYETGIVCKRLVRYGWPMEKVAAEMGLGVEWVEKLLLLIGGPRQLRDAVVADELAATEAIDMFLEYGENVVAELERRRAKAREAGKTRITAKYASGQSFKKLFTRSSQSLYQAAKEVISDPGFAGLKPETQSKLSELLAQLQAAEAADAAEKAELKQSA